MPKDISKEVEIHRILRWTKIWEEKCYVWDLGVDSKLIMLIDSYILIMFDLGIAWKRALPGPLHLKYRISTHRSPCDLHGPVSAMKRSWHGQYGSSALKRKHASQHEQQINSSSQFTQVVSRFKSEPLGTHNLANLYLQARFLIFGGSEASLSTCLT